MIDNSFDVKQARGGDIDSQQPKAMLGSGLEMFFKIVDQKLVQVDKGFEFQLYSGFRQGYFWNDSLSHVEAVDNFEEFIQLILAKSSDEVDEKNNQHIEGTFSLTSEISVRVPVTFDKL